MSIRRERRQGGLDSTASEGLRAKPKRNYLEFVAEAEDHLERMLRGLAVLADEFEESDEPDPELINQIFRSAHTLKGLAGMFGDDSIGSVAHHLEDILGGLRLGKVGLDSQSAQLLEEGVAVVAELIEQVGEADSSVAERLRIAEAFGSDVVAALEADAEVAIAGNDEFSDLDLPSEVLDALTEYEEHRLLEGLRRGREIILIDSGFELTSFEEGLSALTEAIRDVGELISTLPSSSSSSASTSEIQFSLLVSSGLAFGDIEDALSIFEIEIRSIRERTVEEVVASRSEVSAITDSESTITPSVATPEKTDTDAGKSHFRRISKTVRVDIRKLDELMNLVGELSIQGNTLGETVSRLLSDPETEKLGAELRKTHHLLDRKLRELQTSVLDVRMVPLNQVFEKLERVARGLRRELGKDVSLEFSGSETELDKLIVERLVDPLVHLLRNAFDHAIETAEERAELGKPIEGRVVIRAFQRGNRVVVEVEDDGRGMSTDEILIKAIEEKRVVQPDLLTRREILNLVFEAGFSTRNEINQTSGRGVGMDVVRENLSEMGGAVEISTTEGAGTTVMIDLPITLAVMQALLVDVSGQRFALPLGSVQETLAIDVSEITRSEGRELMNLRGEALLLCRLDKEFALSSVAPPKTESATQSDRIFVVVVGLGDQRLGLIVEGLVGQRDAMIKPIKGPLKQIRGIAGATELGDQDAILVIDVSAIVADAGRHREAE